MMSDGARVDRSKYLYAKTVKGRPYLYFRMRDRQLVPLPLDRDCAEFRRAYDACRKTRDKVAEQKVKAEPVQPVIMKQVAFIGGTVGKAIETFKRSPEYVNDLRPSSRYIYDKAFDIMRDKIGTALLADFADVDVVDTFSSEMSVSRWVTREVRGTMKKVRQGGPSSADLHITLLSMIWRVCRKYPEFGIKKLPNPFTDAERRYTKPRNPALPWSDEQQDKFVTTAPDYLAVAYLMLKYFGQRGGDCIAVEWTQFGQNAEGKWGIAVAPEKGHDPELEFLELPRVLVDALKRAQKKRGNACTILVNTWGKPWSSSMSLSQSIRLHLIKIGLAKRGTKTISMHGLRKSAAILAAETDLGVAGIKTITLHKSDAMANYYAKRREQAKLRSKVVARINEMETEKAAAKQRAKRATIRSVK